MHLATKINPNIVLQKGTDQATAAHKVLYKEFDNGLCSPLIQIYRQLCEEWVVDLSELHDIDLWAIQRYPSVRIHLPGNVSVFEFHKDSDYKHPLGEINHFLSLTRSHDTAALQVEDHLGWGDYKPLNLEKAQSAILNTSIFRHGDLPNQEGYTRVSIDFRAIPLKVLDLQAPSRSLTKVRNMDCNDYFIRSDRLHIE
jgi:hypothetical protein